MRAVVHEKYRDSDVLELTEQGPPPLADDGVLVRVAVGGVNMADWHLMSGRPTVARLVLGVRAPRKPGVGVDLAGTVEAVGPAVTGLHVGDRVFGAADGAFAELAATREHRLTRIPDGVSFQAAAATPMAGTTALHALRTGRVTVGSRVLVLGAGGGVGSMAVQLAVAAGARVTGVTSAGKLDLVRSLGAAEVIDRADVAAWGTGYDAVIVTGGLTPLSALRRLLGPRGTLALVGGEGGGTVIGGGLRLQLRAAVVDPFVRQRLRGVVSKENPADLARLRDALADGSLAPAIERSWPLVEVAAAIDHIATGGTRGKVVLIVS